MDFPWILVDFHGFPSIFLAVRKESHLDLPGAHRAEHRACIAEEHCGGDAGETKRVLVKAEGFMSYIIYDIQYLIQEHIFDICSTYRVHIYYVESIYKKIYDMAPHAESLMS